MRALALLPLLCLLAAAPKPGLAQPAEDPAGAARETRVERSWLTPQRVAQGKSALAFAGAALLAWGALTGGGTPKRRRGRDALLLALGSASLLGWWNFGAFNFPVFAHTSDSFHYYVGSKYFAELGYERLYACTAAADAEAGLREQVAQRYLRDLARNEIVGTAAALAHPEACTSHFTAARWESFQRDVAWFRSGVNERRWAEMQVDHGYNATPLWTALGGALANLVPANDAGMLALRLLDPLLLALLWAAVVYAFGWRAACVALLYWGTNHPAQHGWTGGSFLRQDWLVAIGSALCALRLGRPAAAGALLALATGLRIFPVLVLAAFALQALVGMLRARRVLLARDHQRLLAGALAAGVLLLLLSLGLGGGARAWGEFAANSRKHLDTPLRNYVGLHTLVSYVPASELGKGSAAERASEDPYQAWKEARRAAGEQRRWLFAALVAGYLALLAVAASRETDWVVGVLGVGLIAIAAELTCYYSAGLAFFGLLWLRRESLGALLCLLSGVGWWIASSGRELDQVYTGISLASVLFIVWATCLLGRRQAHDGLPPQGKGEPSASARPASRDSGRTHGSQS
jgi:hypothetical protein